MSADRIDQLHEKASGHYLNGDYRAAIVAWNELLTLDPANEQALEGVRMSTLLGEQEGTEVPLGLGDAEEPPAESSVRALDDEIEHGLSVFDSIPAPEKQAAPRRSLSPDATLAIDRAEIEAMLRPPAAIGDVDPDRQGSGIDFGDLAALPAIPIAPSGAASSADPEQGAEAVGLELAVEAPPRLPEIPSAAQAALRHRVGDLLVEARARRDEGDRDAALAVIARVYILDETNGDARALEAELREASAGDLAAVESWIIEGVQAFDQGRLGEARELFGKVQAIVPDHREAQHYLEAIAERESGHGDISEDLLGGGVAPSDGPPPPPRDESADLGEGLLLAEAIRPARERAPRPAPAEATPETARRGWSLPKWALLAGLLVVAAGLGVVFLPGLVGGKATDAPSAAPPPARRGVTAPRDRAGTPAAPAPKPAPPPAASATEALRAARAAMDRGDFARAVLAYNEAITLDATSEEAREGIQEAGERYKAKKAEQDQLDGVRMAFQGGEYASALRVLYRLPDTIDRAKVDRWKVDGWFNLGVVALRAGEAPAAQSHFDEALAIMPDPEVSKWRAFAQRYRNLPKDRVYYDAAEAIAFRELE